MKREKLDRHIEWLENLLQEFEEAKKQGKETNSNEERVKSIERIEEVTQRLETYIQNNEDLLEVISGSKIEIAREIEWNEVVRPQHFAEDLQEEIKKLKNIKE